MGALFSKKNPQQQSQMIYGNISQVQAEQLARQFNMPVERVNLLRQKYLQYRGRNQLINVYNFMILYREFANANASEVDIYKVFNAFDVDRDGLINFVELLRAVSMQPQVSTTPPPLNPNILQMLPPCEPMSPLPPPLMLPPSSSFTDLSVSLPPPPIPLPRYKRKLIWQPPDDYYPTVPRRKLKKVIVYVPRRRPRSYSPPPVYYRRYKPSTPRRHYYDYSSDPYVDYDSLGRSYDTIIRKPRSRNRYLDDFDLYY